MVATRVCFIIDGFNVYHSICEALRTRPGTSMKWLDLQELCRSYLGAIGGGAQLERVFWFSAPADFSTSKAERHEVYVQALKATGVAVQLGRFKEKDVYCNRCKTTFKRHEEKETDVAIALKLLELLVLDACDTVVLVSGDTDLAPSIRTAKVLFPTKKIVMLFPFGRLNIELERLAHRAIKIKAKSYAAHQLPDPLKTPDDSLIWKPLGW